MVIVAAVLLAVAVLLALAYPVLRSMQGPDGSAVSASQETLGELLNQRDAAFQAIRDLQFDHEVGKITDEDLVVYEANLKLHAAEVLRRLDAWEKQADAELGGSLESEIAARRAALTRGSVPCPSCGRPVAAGNEFCTTCGAHLAAQRAQAAVKTEPACPHCGRPVQPDDRFCPRCGQGLAQPLAGNPVAG